MFEKKVLRRIFGPKRDVVAGGKRQLGRPRYMWVANIKINLKEIRWGGMEWIGLAEGRDEWRAPLNTVINLRVL
jgi:hypothetical protein